VARYKAKGLAGLADRSSRPRHQYRPVAPAIAERVIALRRQRLTGKHIAKITAVSAATVSRVLKRAGLRPAELPIWTSDNRGRRLIRR
jgi:DNA invertase Pin-like site-specific DNA recombinase